MHIEEFPRVKRVRAEGIWSDVMDIRKRCLKALEEARGEGGTSNPLDVSVCVAVRKELLSEIEKFEGELEDLCGVSRLRVTEGDEIRVELTDISSEPRCERSWKRGESVRERQNGSFLSERDALALGL